jgi:phosphohistidine phosphatase
VAPVIWLLRHAEAEDGTPDAERPLTKKGRRQSEAAGRALAALGIEFEACLTSPKVRALDTARIACEHLGIEPAVEDALSGGNFDPLELAAGLDSVLLVGHEPSFSAAVQEVTGGRVAMKKGGIVALDGNTLAGLLRPAELKAIAGLT